MIFVMSLSSSENQLTWIYLCTFLYISIKFSKEKRANHTVQKNSGKELHLPSLAKTQSPFATEFRTFTYHKLFEADSPHNLISWRSLASHPRLLHWTKSLPCQLCQWSLTQLPSFCYTRPSTSCHSKELPPWAKAHIVAVSWVPQQLSSRQDLFPCLSGALVLICNVC